MPAGAWTGENAVAPAVDPAGAITVTMPVPAPAGTMAVICVLESTLNSLDGVPSNSTPVAPLNPRPEITTAEPGGPEAGVTPVTDKVTVKGCTVLVTVPPGVITPIGPLLAPSGTVAVRVVSLLIW